MLAEKDEYMQEAAGSIFMANADEMIRQRCLAREEAERHERTMKRDMKKLQDENQNLKESLVLAEKEINELKKQMQHLLEKTDRNE